MARPIPQRAATAAAGTSEYKKAAGFLNLKIKTSAGLLPFSKSGIALYSENPIHAKVLALIEDGSDPTELLGILECTFQPTRDEEALAEAEFSF